MGVHINMEMPENGSCIQIVIDDDGEVYPSVEKCILKMGSIAKAAPVPPHGRLIDADALMHEFEKAQRTMQQHGREYSCSFMSSSQEISTEWYCVEDMLDNAPTIIEAEEGENAD